VHRILTEHPAVHSITDESYLFIKNTDDRILDELNRWNEEAKRNGKEVILEKTPYHLYYFNRINEFLPDCFLISMIRDGRDVVASYMASGHTLEWGIEYWSNCMEYIDELKNKIANHHVLKLEDLTKNPEKELSILLDKIGLDSAENIIGRMLRYHEKRKTYYHPKIEMPPNALEGENKAMLRNFQVNQPLFKNTSRWQKEIPPERHDELNEKLGYWLNRYGYLKSPTDSMP
jgi:hypothetical protein